MPIERTFSIIKPDATARNLTGAINAMIEAAGLRIIAQRRLRISRDQAETFYAVHKARPFFGELVDFMISGPVVVQVLEGDNAIARYRDLMGATDPAKAAARIRCMAPTRPIPRRRKSPSSFAAMTS
jgi:nucleoside-diphosphate kinase